MNYGYQPADRSSRYRGLAVVMALHVLLAWALVSGTARKGLEILKKPLEAVVIQEVFIPPPPPPPPPPPKEVKPPEPMTPKVAPPFVPAPEVPAPATAAPAVTAAPTPPAAPPAIVPPAPPAPPAPVAAPAPVAVAPTPAPPAPSVAKAPSKPDVGVDCPTQVKPEYPRKALQDGIQGVVKVQALVKDGAVREVTFLSGPRVFHAAVRSAMLQYKCAREPAEYLVTQEFPFKME